MSAEPASRRKSCGECAKAKRKCGMESPRCRRCQKKNIACLYPNKSTSINEMNFPELEFSWLDDWMRDSGTLPWSDPLPAEVVHSISPPTISGNESQPEVASYTVPDYLLAPEGRKKTMLPRIETEAAVRRFKSWPEKWLKEAKAPFIHPHLYSSAMPKALQDAYSACAIFSTKTTANSFVAFTVIESKANELLNSHDQASWTPLDLLAAVQSLLIFQFIRLFDGDIRQRSLAENAAPTLEAWTEELRVRTEEERNYTSFTAPSWQSWLFAESARRSITMSIFLSGIYSLLKLGYCTLGDKVTANSFTAQKALWEADSALEWERIKLTSDPYWIPRMNFEHLLQDAKGTEVDDFCLVMLISYKGQDMVDDWLASTDVMSERVGTRDLQQSLIDVVNLNDVGSSSSSAQYSL